jgi:hypothetical protein
VTLGIVAGLVIGKPLGITLAAWLAVRTRIGVLPQGVTMIHVAAAGMLAGIGFPVALFVAGLAFTDHHPHRRGQGRPPQRLARGGGLRRNLAAVRLEKHRGRVTRSQCRR